MTFSERIHERRKAFKNIGDTDDIRRRREDETVQIRKKDKEEQIARRRKLVELSSDIPGVTVCFGAIPLSAESIPQFVDALMSSDPLLIAEASIAIRKILSIDRRPPINEVLRAGILPRMKQLLADDRYPNTQLETCWSLTNIASGTPEQTEAVVVSGVVPLFVKLLSSPDSALQEQAVWAVANIAGDRTEFRDGCIAAGTVGALCRLIESSLGTCVQMTRLATWGLSNMCRGKPAPPFEQLIGSLPVLGRVVATSNDSEVLADAAWALSYLTDTCLYANVLRLLEKVDLDRLVALLAHPSGSVHTPILRVVGNLLSGEPGVARRVVSSGVLGQFQSLLSSNKKSVRKETLWAISNVCADSQAHLQSVMDSGLMERVCEFCRSGTCDMDLKKEAIWSICNACTVGEKSQIDQLVQDSKFDILPPMCAFLESARDTKSIKTVLDSIHAVLSHNRTLYPTLIEECGGLTTIEDLQQDQSEDVYQASVRILETFFVCEEETEDGKTWMDSMKENVAFDFSASSSRLLAPRNSDVARSG